MTTDLPASDLEALIAARFVDFEGAYNVRDLGGLTATDGTVRTGRIFRADSPSDLTAADRAKVVDLNVGLVLDLRSGIEAEAGSWAVADHIQRQNFEVIDPASHPHLSPDAGAALPDIVDAQSFADRYELRLTNGAREFVAAANAVTDHLASTDSAVLFNCSAGKDRTGLLAAFLLSAVGVDRALIVADYAASTEPMRRKVADRMANPGSEPIDFTQIPPLLLEAPAEVMERTLDWLDRAHGGIVAFFVDAGFGTDQLESLRHHLVA